MDSLKSLGFVKLANKAEYISGTISNTILGGIAGGAIGASTASKKLRRGLHTKYKTPDERKKYVRKKFWQGAAIGAGSMAGLSALGIASARNQAKQNQQWEKAYRSTFDDDFFKGFDSSYRQYSRRNQRRYYGRAPGTYRSTDSLLKTLGTTQKNIKSKKDLKKLHRELTKKYHPDTNPSAGTKMRDINSAMDDLKKSPWYGMLKEAILKLKNNGQVKKEL